MTFCLRLLLVFLLAAATAGFFGCETIQFGSDRDRPDTVKTDTVDTNALYGVASFTVGNFRKTSPAPLVFLLFTATAQDVETADPVMRLDTTDTNGTLTRDIPAGRWKLAYEVDGSRHAMPSDSVEELSRAWPVVAIYRNRKYWASIGTMPESEHTVWQWIGQETGYSVPVKIP